MVILPQSRIDWAEGTGPGITALGLLAEGENALDELIEKFNLKRNGFQRRNRPHFSIYAPMMPSKGPRVQGDLPLRPLQDVLQVTDCFGIRFGHVMIDESGSLMLLGSCSDGKDPLVSMRNTLHKGYRSDPPNACDPQLKVVIADVQRWVCSATVIANDFVHRNLIERAEPLHQSKDFPSSGRAIWALTDEVSKLAKFHVNGLKIVHYRNRRIEADGDTIGTYAANFQSGLINEVDLFEKLCLLP
jgi:hypothetical protein